MNKQDFSRDLKMYFDPHLVNKFTKLEENEKYDKIAQIIDRVIYVETKDISDPLLVAELGGGSHPDKYDLFFKRLLQHPQGHIDWVDLSKYMLEEARKYLLNEKFIQRKKVISFIQNDILKYLQNLEESSLNLVIMKYTFDHIQDIESLFMLLSKKLKKGGKLIANSTTLNSYLNSSTTNARILINGQEFPLNEKKKMKDGDSFTVKFYKKSGNPKHGYLDGAETTKYFHSITKIKELATENSFSVFVGDWKNVDRIFVQGLEDMNVDLLVLTKK